MPTPSEPPRQGPEAHEAFAQAITAQQHLTQALIGAGLDPETDLPQMVADVTPAGEPRIVLGPITIDTAERLARAISAPKRKRR